MGSTAYRKIGPVVGAGLVHGVFQMRSHRGETYAHQASDFLVAATGRDMLNDRLFTSSQQGRRLPGRRQRLLEIRSQGLEQKDIPDAKRRLIGTPPDS